MIEYFKKLFRKIVRAENSPYKLTASFCLGNYVAFSPFLGVHTLMAFVLSYILRLNAVVAVTVLYLINNPLTMVPILVVDYIFGQWFFEDILHINMIGYNPQWMDWFNNNIGHYITDAHSQTRRTLTDHIRRVAKVEGFGTSFNFPTAADIITINTPGNLFTSSSSLARAGIHLVLNPRYSVFGLRPTHASSSFC